MKQIIGAFGTLFVLMLNIFICITLSTVSAEVAAAKEYKADVIAEIENSDFNPNVIDGCKVQAAAEGYQLTVTNCTYNSEHSIQTAEIILEYSYRLPLFGIAETRTTRGIAR